MPLKYTVDSLDGLDEATKGLYKADGDKFKLDVEGLPKGEDVSGLKNALTAERNEHADAKKELGKWRKLGKTADEVSETISNLKTEKPDNAQHENFIAQLKAQHESALAEKDKKLQMALDSERKAVVSAGFKASLTKAGFTDAGIEMIPQVAGHRVRMVEVGDTRVPQILAEGSESAMVGSGPNSNATFDDLAEEYAKKFPDLVRSDRKGGAGTAPGSGGSGSEKTIKRADFDNLAPMDKSRLMKDGTKVVD